MADFKLTGSAGDESARQSSLNLSPAPFDEPERDTLRRRADHLSATATEADERERWNDIAALLSDENPNFEADAKRAAARRVRRAHL